MSKIKVLKRHIIWAEVTALLHNLIFNSTFRVVNEASTLGECYITSIPVNVLSTTTMGIKCFNISLILLPPHLSEARRLGLVLRIICEI